MSSHHIVRENQEPALLIAHARALSFQKIQELLEWMPTVIVVYTEVEQVLSWGIKVDVVFVPQNEIEFWRNRLMDQAPVKLITFNPDDDLFTVGLYFLNASRATGVNILMADKLDLDKLLLYSNLNVEVFIENKRWGLIKSGKVDKWFPQGSMFSIYPSPRNVEIKPAAVADIPIAQDGVLSFFSDYPFWLGEALY